MIINAIAPCRICDIGGWTDTHFSKFGEIFNIAIYPYVKVQLSIKNRSINSSQIHVNAAAYGEKFGFDANNFINDKHALIRGAFKIMDIPDNLSVSANIYSDMPPGASTGTSAAVSVALIGALNKIENKFSLHEIPLLAHRVETEILKLQCGIQDQVASTFGGINRISITDYPNYYRSYVEISDKTWWELERRLMLVYLGHSHNSSEIHKAVIKGFENKDNKLETILSELRYLPKQANQFIEQDNFRNFAGIMTKNTSVQKSLHPCMMGEDIYKIEELAVKSGAIGVKLNGAGGYGGSLTLLFGTNEEDKVRFAKSLQNIVPKAQIIPIYLSRKGLRVW